MKRLFVTAKPGSREERVEAAADGGLCVWVKARAIGGAANEAIEKALAEALGLKRWQVSLEKGLTAKKKTVFIDISAEEWADCCKKFPSLL